MHWIIHLNQCIHTNEQLYLFPKSYNKRKSSFLACSWEVNSVNFSYRGISKDSFHCAGNGLHCKTYYYHYNFGVSSFSSLQLRGFQFLLTCVWGVQFFLIPVWGSLVSLHFSLGSPVSPHFSFGVSSSISLEAGGLLITSSLQFLATSIWEFCRTRREKFTSAVRGSHASRYNGIQLLRAPLNPRYHSTVCRFRGIRVS